MRDEKILSPAERADYALRELFAAYGYARYKVNRFEEYDLYARNRTFLVSENILTFTDTDGKLLALKPDVTLSIVKSTRVRRGALRKVYYSENVYRPSGGSMGFKEIMQTGLECIGNVDVSDEAEVLMLACRSLERLSEEYILNISHAGILPSLLSEYGVREELGTPLAALLGEKNVHGIKRLCEERGLSELGEKLSDLALLYGTPAEALPRLLAITPSAATEELAAALELLRTYGLDGSVRLDLSLVNDMNYYSGIVFRGNVKGLPDGVLSGGRYDYLVKKMGLSGGAIGFAVYLDELDRLAADAPDPDVDTVILYDEDTDPVGLIRKSEELRREGRSIRVSKDPLTAMGFSTLDLRGEAR